ncbi:hypothetical protein EV421DRAFT_2041180 [Armillaria borealis]|uniref:Uncharacterized protein n=1 Tax=Armillaria borealis TaxID=47425 RepID=A0AA39ME84_9AGAR|nr:hypothetical protein EV421DRAFT_2041180 [Armillaria borealis]
MQVIVLGNACTYLLLWEVPIFMTSHADTLSIINAGSITRFCRTPLGAIMMDINRWDQPTSLRRTNVQPSSLYDNTVPPFARHFPHIWTEDTYTHRNPQFGSISLTAPQLEWRADDVSTPWFGVEADVEMAWGGVRHDFADRETWGTRPTLRDCRTTGRLAKTRRTDRAEGSRRPKDYGYGHIQLQDGHIIFEKDHAFAVLRATPPCTLDRPILSERHAYLVLSKLAATQFLQCREHQQLLGGNHGMSLLPFAATYPLRFYQPRISAGRRAHVT